VGGAFLGGALLRFWNLPANPPALYCDEAFHGYQAWSLLLTGADMRGVAWPLFFDIFGVGWEEPLYVYLTMVPVRIFGPTAAAPRMVAAAAGALSILAVAWLAGRIGGRLAGAVAALTMAFSPWAFHLSRVGFQASLLPLFLAAGSAALMRGVGRTDEDAARRPISPGWVVAGAMLLTLSLYTYVAARPIVPLLVAGFLALHPTPLRRLPGRWKLLAAAALLVPIIPLAIFSFSPEGLERFRDVGLPGSSGGSAAALRFASNYLGYFSPSFLLTDGDPNLRHSVAGFGVLHLHDLALALAGLAWALIRRRPGGLYIAWWLAVAPLAASLTADPAHAVRAIGALPAIHVLAGLGASMLFGPRGVLRPRALWSASAAPALTLILFAGISTVRYMDHYFTRYPIYSAPVWQYGLGEAYGRIEEIRAGHDAIYVTRAEDFPWIQRLYLLGFPPDRYQRSGFEGTGYLFDEPVFYRGDQIPGRHNPIFMLKPSEAEAAGLPAREVIPYPDGSPAFVLSW
jgi:4-amino-4-deoxy-L-arabinose transferase-like glycosyltransferase